MKTILSGLIFSLVSSVVFSAPAKPRDPAMVALGRDVYVCKNSESNLIYLANRTEKRILVLKKNYKIKNGKTEYFATADNLVVDESYPPSDSDNKEEISYTFSKVENGVKKPLMEIELTQDRAAKEVTYAEAKIMGVIIDDENDIDLNLHCKSSKE